MTRPNDTYELDHDHEPFEIGGAALRFVVTSEGRPVIWHKRSGASMWMAYRTQLAATKARLRVAITDDFIEVAVYDKEVAR